MFGQIWSTVASHTIQHFGNPSQSHHCLKSSWVFLGVINGFTYQGVRCRCNFHLWPEINPAFQLKCKFLPRNGSLIGRLVRAAVRGAGRRATVWNLWPSDTNVISFNRERAVIKGVIIIVVNQMLWWLTSSGRGPGSRRSHLRLVAALKVLWSDELPVWKV